MSRKKDFIGKTMAARPGLMDEDREQLVVLRPTGTVKQLIAGAHLSHPDDPAQSDGDQG